MKSKGTKKGLPYSAILNCMAMYIILHLLPLFSACNDRNIAQADYAIVPLPQKIVLTEGLSFVPDRHTVIVYDTGNETQKRTAGFLVGFLKEHAGLDLPTASKAPSDNFIRLTHIRKQDAPESYTLTVTAKNITIEGADEAGIFYGIGTLCKSVPSHVTNGKISFPQVKITDAPRFHYRGMMLDVCRHFYSIDFVKKYIDLLALHNINYFHWHLTDDQGWRIEIKKYPALTETGSHRRETIEGMSDSRFDGVSHGGYYTQDEIREVVRYAQERFITVIPEIDIPGHTLSALASYPQLGCTGGPYEVCTRWGVFEDVLCAGNEEVYTFLQNVLDEVVELFPSEYIHLGGDECPKTRWKSCPKCQKRIASLGLKPDACSSAEDKLQGYLMNRIEKYLAGKGKRIIGWDEVLQSGISNTATVMSWQGMKGGIRAAQQHHEVIMTPNTHLYFDYFQTTETDSLPYAYPGYNPIERVYHFEPVPAELKAEERKYIKGVQANLWTEFIADSCQVEKMVLPRMAALAEIQWTSGSDKDYSGFLKRLYRFSRWYEKLSYQYATVPFDIRTTIKNDTLNGKLLVEMSVFDSIPVYYTLDGTAPTIHSHLYTAPFAVDTTVLIKAQGISDDRQTGIYTKAINFNKATLKPITLLSPALSHFASDPKGSALVDGQSGNKILYGGNLWTGFYGKMSLIIDLKKETDITVISAGVLLVPYKGQINYTCSYSPDNISFTDFASGQTTLEQYGNIPITFEKVKTRYIKINMEKQNPGAIVCDEIRIH